MAEATGSSRGQLIGIGDKRSVPFNWVNDFPASAADQLAAGGGYAPVANFRVMASVTATPGAILHETHYRRAQTALTDDIYLDFCRDHQISFGCQTDLIVEPGVMIGLAVLRTDADGSSTAAQRRAFARASRAARTAVRLQHAIEHRGAELLTGTFEAMRISAFLFDAFGRVVSATPQAQQAMRSDWPVCIADAQLAGVTAAQTRAVQLALRALLVEKALYQRVMMGRSRRIELFRLPRCDWAMRYAPCAIAVLRDGDDDLMSQASVVGQAYGLSASELVIAVELARGRDRGAIAQGRGVSGETLKSQIKSIFQKTGCGREAELVALMAGFAERRG